MGWILDNLQIVIVVGSTIAWWLTQRKQGEDESPPPSDRPGRQKIDVEQMERNRRLREEIRRKRQERQAGNSAPSPQLRERAEEVPTPRQSPGMEVPEDVSEQIPPVLRELMGIPEPRPAGPVPVPPPLPEINPVTERQNRIEQEMAELEAKRREAKALAARARGSLPGVTKRRRRRSTSSSSLSDRDFLATLRNPGEARRAIVLREILGKPLALR